MKSYELSTSEEFINLVQELSKASDLNEIEAKEVEILIKEIEKKKAIPAEEYKEYSELCAKNQGLWEEAKSKNDYAAMQEGYRKIFDFNKKFATYRRKDEKIYMMFF